MKLATFETRQELANELHIHIRTLERWLVKYKAVGVRDFINIDKRNKKSAIITDQVHQLLDQKLHDEKDPLLGYADAHRWINEQTGIEITYHNLRYYLIRHFHSKLKTPRKSHVKKDVEAQAAF